MTNSKCIPMYILVHNLNCVLFNTNVHTYTASPVLYYYRFLSSLLRFRVSVFDSWFPILWFPVTWLDCFWVFKSSQSQSLYHDLCLDSLENSISGFHLQFMISRYLAWSWLGLQVLSESEPLSWSLLRFCWEWDYGFLPLVSESRDAVLDGI